MALTNDDGSSGTTSTVCTPSPADNLAVLNNYGQRISDIERFLSRLIAADVTANNLAELATDLGNVLNGSIVLPGDSWAGPGGSIPVPDDFSGTVISGNVTTIWTNGVVSFQVDNTGIVAGGGGVTKWAQVNILSSGSSITAINVLSDTSNLISVSSPTITILQSGLYLFGLSDALTISTTGAAYGFLTLTDNSFTLPGQATVAQFGLVMSGSTSGSKFARGGSSLVTTIPTASFALTAAATVSAGTWNHIGTLSVLKLS